MKPTTNSHCLVLGHLTNVTPVTKCDMWHIFLYLILKFTISINPILDTWHLGQDTSTISQLLIDLKLPNNPIFHASTLFCSKMTVWQQLLIKIKIEYIHHILFVSINIHFYCKFSIFIEQCSVTKAIPVQDKMQNKAKPSNFNSFYDPWNALR